MGEPPALLEPVPDHTGQPSAPGGRWCPYCGADLSHVPTRDVPHEEAMFAAVGRRLRVAIAVGFVLVWLIAEMWDWFEDPATVLLPAWYSALGAIMLFYLLGVGPMMGLFRRR